MHFSNDLPDPTEALEQGLNLCRQGRWRRGVSVLATIAAVDDRSQLGNLPGLYYSYLGYGVALTEGKLREGMQLCEHAVKVEFYQPENYLNLARVYLLANYRRRAVRAVLNGLKIDPQHPNLLALHQDLGIRRRPLFPFLSRSHPINRVLGWIRHQLKRDLA